MSEPVAARAARLRRRLAGLAPAELARRFPGPLFQKEVRVHGRRGATYWTRSLYCLLLLGVMVVFYLSISRGYPQGTTERMQNLQLFAPMLTITMAWVQFLALPLLGAGLCAPTVSEEVRTGTLATLLTTPLTASQIIVGKMAGAIVQLGVLALIGAPLLLAARVFGGVRADAVIAVTCVSLSTAFLACALGVLFSTLSRRAAGATVLAIIAVAAIVLLPLFVQYLCALAGISTSASPTLSTPAFLVGWGVPAASVTLPSVSEVATYTASPVALFRVSMDVVGSMGMAGAGTSRSIWVICSIYQAALAFGVLLLSSALLRGVMRRMSEGRAAALPEPAPPGAPASSARTPRRAPRVVADDPVVWREVRMPGVRSRVLRRLAALGALGIPVLIFSLAGVGDREVYIGLSVTASILVLVIGAAGTAGGITGERESRTWDLLLTTPLSARQIILGKFIGALRRQWFIPGVILGVLMVGTAAGTLHPLVVPHAIFVLVPIIMAMSALGVLLSQVRRRTASAVALSFGVWLVLWIALPMVVGVLGSAMYMYSSFNWLEEILLAIITFNPVFLIVVVADGAGSLVTTSAAPYEWGPHSIGPIPMTGVLLGVGGAYLAATWVFLALATRSLAAQSARAR